MSQLDHDLLLDEYAEKIRPLLPLATKAYGRRDQDTPAHKASREYTNLLCEFHRRSGSLQKLAEKVGVSYSGMRRRVHTANIPPLRSPRKASKDTINVSMVEHAADRVRQAKITSVEKYHEQLFNEFNAGVPMNMLARELGISNAAPLYYGVQCHYKRSLTTSS
jgi:hypothetical protein